jgi:hypothetical protein
MFFSYQISYQGGVKKKKANPKIGLSH